MAAKSVTSFSPGTSLTIKSIKMVSLFQSRGSKEKKDAVDAAWTSPYGCHNEPDMEEFPLPNMNTMPDDPLRAGEQYFLDLAGNIKKGPIPTPKATACYCGPAFEKFEKKLERDKKELLKHIDTSHSKLDNKISHLEKKTRDQLFNLNQSMKESFALERSECLDRMDRRALRERIAIERQQAVRDVGLKRDLASWLDKKLQEIEVKHGADTKNSALLRTLASTRARATRADPSTDAGTLRRAMSEELLSDVGVLSPGDNVGDHDESSDSVYKGLKVSDKPRSRVRRSSAGDGEERGQETPVFSGDHGPVTSDILGQHSTASESYHDTSVSDRGSVVSATRDKTLVTSDNSTNYESSAPDTRHQRTSGLIRPIPMVYSSDTPPQYHAPPPGQYQPPTHYPTQMPPIRRFTTEADIHHASPLILESPSHTPTSSLPAPPYRAPPHPAPSHVYHPRDRLARPGPLLPPVDEDEYVPLDEKDQDFHRQLLNIPLQSDVLSHDSHNDSGYSTRLGASAGPSPSLSGEFSKIRFTFVCLKALSLS